MTDDLTVSTAQRFDEMALAPSILKAISEVGYETPSAIQAESIPLLLEGRDLIGQAQTGTGKTAAFALPLLSRIDLKQRHPQLLVLTPTRELAIQVAEAMQTYARYMPDFHVLPIYGGQGMGQQLRQLERGVQVVVGTPGRILDHLGRKTLDLSQLQAVVLDEADEMLRMGFIDDVDEILSHTPPERQVALFSATMPEPIRRIALRHLHEPAEIKIATKTSTVEAITQRYWLVTGVHKLDALTRILEVIDFDAMIIFVRTKVLTEELAEKLEARGYSCAALNGDLNQQQRERTIEKLKDGKLDIVVATDVAARGLDVPRISHVVNYDIPTDTESYVHRIGRTGRAGRTGEAILFVAPREKRMLYAIEQATRQKIEPMPLPTRSEIVDRRIQQFKKQMSDTLENQDLSFFRELVESFQTEQTADMEDIAAALVYLVQADQPLQPDIRDIPATSAERGRGRDRDSRETWEGAAERGGRRERGERRENPVDSDMCRYRIEVGRVHGVQPKNIVGAIANEINLDSKLIGNIGIRDEFSLLDLPAGMPKDLLNHLKKVRVCGQALNISVDKGGRARRDEESPERPPRRARPDYADYANSEKESGVSERPERAKRSVEDRPVRERPARPKRESFDDSFSETKPRRVPREQESADRPIRAKKTFEDRAERPARPKREGFEDRAERPARPKRETFGEHDGREVKAPRQDKPYAASKAVASEDRSFETKPRGKLSLNKDKASPRKSNASTKTDKPKRSSSNKGKSNAASRPSSGKSPKRKA